MKQDIADKRVQVELTKSNKVIGSKKERIFTVFPVEIPTEKNS